MSDANATADLQAVALQERIDRLQAATARGSELEQAMLHDQIELVSANGTANPGTSLTYVVAFKGGRKAIHKPFEGQNPNSCKHYAQDRYEVPTHEVVAWRLAHALGGRWAEMVPTAVLRRLATAGPGVLINWRDGQPGDGAVVTDQRDQVFRAAFWDALVGQQDRHAQNFRYDAAAGRLALIDHGFAFARPTDRFASSVFHAYRLQRNYPLLTKREEQAIEALLEGGDLLGLAGFLPEDRAEALAGRARTMRQTRRLPLPGAF